MIYFRKRKSVIVKHSSTKVPNKIEKLEENCVKTVIKDVGDDFILKKNYVQTLSEGTLDIDKPAVHEMCTKYMILEDNGYLDNVKICFESSLRYLEFGNG